MLHPCTPKYWVMYLKTYSFMSQCRTAAALPLVLPEHSTGCRYLSHDHGFCGCTIAIIQKDVEFQGIMATSVSGFNTPWLVSILWKGGEFIKNACTEKIPEMSRVKQIVQWTSYGRNYTELENWPVGLMHIVRTKELSIFLNNRSSLMFCEI